MRDKEGWRGSKKPKNLRDVIYGWSLREELAAAPDARLLRIGRRRRGSARRVRLLLQRRGRVLHGEVPDEVKKFVNSTRI